MGVDAKALLTSNPSPVDIMQWLNRHNAVKGICIRPTSADGFVQVHFDWLADTRMMAVFYDGACAADYKNVHPGPAAYCSIGRWGHSSAIVNQLAENFGGFVMLDDSKDDWRHVEQCPPTPQQREEWRKQRGLK